MVMFFSQACRCGRLGAPATLSFHPVLIVFLCFEIRCLPSLSLWTAWHARNSELIMLFGDMVVAVCICEVAESLLLHAAVPCFVNDVS